jgi:hypothetical protein
MAAMHTSAGNVNAHPFTSDLTLISFRILILVSLQSESAHGSAPAIAKTPVVLSRHDHQTNAALMRVDDSRPSTDEYENGMNAARSVMKAAG